MKTKHAAIRLSQSRIGQRRHGGMTLVELMVALTIGLIILVALGQLFVTSRATYTAGEGSARTQESGRFAMEFLTHDIRMAGYAGCNNPGAPGVVSGAGVNTACSTSFCDLVDPADEATGFAEGVRSYTYTGDGTANDRGDWTPALPDAFFNDGEVNARTDVITVQYASSTNTFLLDPAPNNANIKIPANSPAAAQIVAGDVMIISDCKNTDAVRATNAPAGDPVATIAHGSVGNKSSHLSHTYGTDAELLTLQSRAYYIAPGTGGEPALFRKNLGAGGAVGVGEELVQGIEDMRFMFGVDTDLGAAADAVADRYVRANEVVNLNGFNTTTWRNVVSLRIGLLMRTPANVDAEPDFRTFDLVDGITVGPMNDSRRRQMYRSTIQLRNW
jgi:type IV pilus assembly protein PilW